jgi:hypothetical protein
MRDVLRAHKRSYRDDKYRIQQPSNEEALRVLAKKTNGSKEGELAPLTLSLMYRLAIGSGKLQDNPNR